MRCPRPTRRWVLLGWLGPLIIAADFLHGRRRGGAFNQHR